MASLKSSLKLLTLALTISVHVKAARYDLNAIRAVRGLGLLSTNFSRDSITNEIREAADKFFNFWFIHGPDKDLGGFHGTLERDGSSVEPRVKGLVAMARHLWTFSTASRLRVNADAKGYAQEMYAFLTQKALNTTTGFFPYFMNADASPYNVTWTTPHVYAHFQVIYALAAHAMAFNDQQSLDLGLRTFKGLDRMYHDGEYGGWDETNSSPEMDPFPKGYNVLLHAMEALAELAYATQGSDPLVMSRLKEAVEILCTRVIQPSTGSARKFFTRDWKPQGPPVTSYGHDIEATHLLLDAVEALRRYGAAASEDLQRYEAVAYKMGATAAREGYDTMYGGFLYEGPPGLDPVSTDDTTPCGAGRTCGDGASHTWWVQFEALLGLWRLYEHTGDSHVLDQLMRTWQWIESHQLDGEYGEAYWLVDRNTQSAKQPAVGGGFSFSATVKANVWKSSYHSGRPLMFLPLWMKGESHR